MPTTVQETREHLLAIVKDLETIDGNKECDVYINLNPSSSRAISFSDFKVFNAPNVVWIENL